MEYPISATEDEKIDKRQVETIAEISEVWTKPKNYDSRTIKFLK